MQQNDRYALYHFKTCPYCAATRRVIQGLDVDIELRDILLKPRHRKDLIAGGGRSQVPCLRIEKTNGDVEWLYESHDIAHYLASRHQPKSESSESAKSVA